MKKRKVKDFIALYAPEDEEKLVLIQSGTSADKTFLDTFWTAHTHALAMADVQTGQVLSGRCCLSWPLTDKERESGDYSKRFAKGNIYRIKTRGWKGDALSEPQWYVTEVLEEGVSCPALEKLWAEYTKPILLEDEVLGTLTLDGERSPDLVGCGDRKESILDPRHQCDEETVGRSGSLGQVPAGDGCSDAHCSGQRMAGRQ